MSPLYKGLVLPVMAKTTIPICNANIINLGTNFSCNIMRYLLYICYSKIMDDLVCYHFAIEGKCCFLIDKE